MKRLLILCVLISLVGCAKTEKTPQETETTTTVTNQDIKEVANETRTIDGITTNVIYYDNDLLTLEFTDGIPSVYSECELTSYADSMTVFALPYSISYVAISLNVKNDFFEGAVNWDYTLGDKLISNLVVTSIKSNDSDNELKMHDLINFDDLLQITKTSISLIQSERLDKKE